MFDVAWFDYDNSVQSGNVKFYNKKFKIVDKQLNTFMLAEWF